MEPSFPQPDFQPSKRQKTQLGRGKEETKDEATCLICFSSSVSMQLCWIDGCDHLFCLTCIIEWAQVAASCPVCKRRFDRIRRVVPPGRTAFTRDVVVPNRFKLLFNSMPSPGDGRRRETERRARPNCTPFRQTQKVHQLGIHRSSSGLAFSSFSLSQSSNDSLFGSSISSWGQNLSRSFRPTFSSWDRGGSPVGGENKRKNGGVELGYLKEREGVDGLGRGELGFGNLTSLKRCKWITQYSDEVYVSFHDECWGLPVYDDRHAFELLALCGMLIDLNWTEILKRRELYRDAFAKFDYTKIVNMEESEIVGIASNKELCLGEGRVRCIVENANCIQKVCEEFGSFREFMWSHVKNKATVNKYKEQRSVPMRSPKAEAISNDLVRRGFRLVGPVIVYSFMQATGMAVDHILDCFRFHECARVANLS